MSIDIGTVRETINHTTFAIGLWSPASNDMVLGTGAQESGYTSIRQLGGGPALSYWQIEPATHDDCWTNFLDFRPALAAKVRALINGANPTSDLLLTSIPYAIAMCRIRYYRVKEPMPDYGDLDGYAAYYKKYYNTPGGAATTDEFLGNWHRLIGAEVPWILPS